MSLSRIRAVVVIAFAIAAASCSDNPTVPRSTAVSASEGASKVVQPDANWFSCATYDARISYICESIGRSPTSPDWWDGNGNWHTTKDCTFFHYSNCDSPLAAGPGGGTASTALSNNTQNDESEYLDMPNCSSPRNSDETAYCSGSPPTSTALTNIQAAIARMSALGGVCATMAAALTRTLTSVPATMTVYAGGDDRFRGFNAASAYDGTANGSEWVTISSFFANGYHDRAHATTAANDPKYYPRTLQQILAHEADHLAGLDHLPSNPSMTPNSQACSDL